MLKAATATLREWTLDWLHLSSTQPAEPTIADPLTIIPRVFAALGAITAVLASPVMNVLVPDLNANAAFVLRLVIAGATLVAVNYVVALVVPPLRAVHRLQDGYAAVLARKNRQAIRWLGAAQDIARPHGSSRL